MENTAENLEHLEHTQHAVHSPFDRRVAMTMAIVAAVLACVTMLSHRAHNETLQLQAEANRHQTEANIYHTRASDQWNFYQAKKIRYHEFQSYLSLLHALAKDPANADRTVTLEQQWTKQVKRYDLELPAMQKDAEELEAQAKEQQKECLESLERSEQAHIRGNRFDLSELGVEMALVLCSISILTKQKGFWMSGLFFGGFGILVAVSVWVLH